MMLIAAEAEKTRKDERGAQRRAVVKTAKFAVQCNPRSKRRQSANTASRERTPEEPTLVRQPTATWEFLTEDFTTPLCSETAAGRWPADFPARSTHPPRQSNLACPPIAHEPRFRAPCWSHHLTTDAFGKISLNNPKTNPLPRVIAVCNTTDPRPPATPKPASKPRYRAPPPAARLSRSAPAGGCSAADGGDFPPSPSPGDSSRKKTWLARGCSSACWQAVPPLVEWTLDRNVKEGTFAVRSGNTQLQLRAASDEGYEGEVIDDADGITGFVRTSGSPEEFDSDSQLLLCSQSQAEPRDQKEASATGPSTQPECQWSQQQGRPHTVPNSTTREANACRGNGTHDAPLSHRNAGPAPAARNPNARGPGQPAFGNSLLTAATSSGTHDLPFPQHAGPAPAARNQNARGPGQPAFGNSLLTSATSSGTHDLPFPQHAGPAPAARNQNARGQPAFGGSLLTAATSSGARGPVTFATKAAAAAAGVAVAAAAALRAARRPRRPAKTVTFRGDDKRVATPQAPAAAPGGQLNEAEFKGQLDAIRDDLQAYWVRASNDSDTTSIHESDAHVTFIDLQHQFLKRHPLPHVRTAQACPADMLNLAATLLGPDGHRCTVQVLHGDMHASPASKRRSPAAGCDRSFSAANARNTALMLLKQKRLAAAAAGGGGGCAGSAAAPTAAALAARRRGYGRWFLPAGRWGAKAPAAAGTLQASLQMLAESVRAEANQMTENQPSLLRVSAEQERVSVRDVEASASALVSDRMVQLQQKQQEAVTYLASRGLLSSEPRHRNSVRRRLTLSENDLW
ncbi:hypothetical protein DIPPA_00092 [Diplonema papillatum]|nr:hypothetical protein DIPPA_00092 [Diplonema papillatum]